MTTKELRDDAKYHYVLSFYTHLLNERIIDEPELREAEKYLRAKYHPLLFKSLL